MHRAAAACGGTHTVSPLSLLGGRDHRLNIKMDHMRTKSKIHFHSEDKDCYSDHDRLFELVLNMFVFFLWESWCDASVLLYGTLCLSFNFKYTQLTGSLLLFKNSNNLHGLH